MAAERGVLPHDLAARRAPAAPVLDEKRDWQRHHEQRSPEDPIREEALPFAVGNHSRDETDQQREHEKLNASYHRRDHRRQPNRGDRRPLAAPTAQR
jgi:hypothetical protein